MKPYNNKTSKTNQQQYLKMSTNNNKNEERKKNPNVEKLLRSRFEIVF